MKINKKIVPIICALLCMTFISVAAHCGCGTFYKETGTIYYSTYPHGSNVNLEAPVTTFTAKGLPKYRTTICVGNGSYGQNENCSKDRTTSGSVYGMFKTVSSSHWHDYSINYDVEVQSPPFN